MRLRGVLLLFLIVCGCFGPGLTAQSQPSASTARRILQKTPAVYPDIARKMNIVGTVRVLALVEADGKVKGVDPMGGSPLLLKAAQDAVLKWRFAPGGETKEIIELNFSQ
jgi:TonB family protein